MTTIYLIRHSKPLKVNNNSNSDSLQIQNEKSSLSIEGENIAREKLDNEELQNIDIIYSSNYVRAIQTAKYLAERNSLEINIDSELGERKFGIDSWDELTEEFEKQQVIDENYKIGNGESQVEVRKRMHNVIMKILSNNNGKRIAVFSHATAIAFLLKQWCSIEINNGKGNIKYNGNTIFNDSLNYCVTFKLSFDDNNSLIDIAAINL
mgnify:CR=1 FL=1